MSKIIPVQVLRAAAALSVAMLHAQHDAGLLAQATGRAFAPFAQFPWAAGVDVFFVISGFIMVQASQGLFATPGARTVFLARRIARIVPIYWAVTTLYIAAALAAPSLLNSALLEPWPVLASYLFIPFARPDGLVQPVYSLGWTLNYEMAFYALFAAAIVLPRRWAVGGLVAVLAALAAVGATWSLPQPLAFWTDGIILEFALGLVLGLLRTEGVVLGGPWRAGLAVVALALFSVDPMAGSLPRAVTWGLPAALLVAAAALGPARDAARGPASRLGAALGDATYALYLLHPFVIRGGRAICVQAGLGDVAGPWAFVAFVLAASVAVALLAHRFFERPATAWARRRLEPSHAERRLLRFGDPAQRQHAEPADAAFRG